MNGLRKNAKNLNFAHFGPKQKFFPKKRTFFSHLQALTNYKVSEKSNERFSSNRVTDARTNGRESLGLQRLRRETKNTITHLHF